jgi:hypothetical protein
VSRDAFITLVQQWLNAHGIILWTEEGPLTGAGERDALHELTMMLDAEKIRSATARTREIDPAVLEAARQASL